MPGSSPAGVATDILPGIHIFFPQAIKQDISNAGPAGKIQIKGDSSVATLGNPTYTVDQSLKYNEYCQLFLCYLIAFDNAKNINP